MTIVRPILLLTLSLQISDGANYTSKSTSRGNITGVVSTVNGVELYKYLGRCACARIEAMYPLNYQFISFCSVKSVISVF